MNEHDRRALAPKTRPSKDEEFYAEWGRRHWFCAACGRTDGLSTHHIIKAGRAHEACNLLRLCLHPCHDLAEGLTVHAAREEIVEGILRLRPGSLLPKITIGIALGMKLRCDPEEVDMARLQHLRGSRLPAPQPIPDFFERLFRQNRPEMICPRCKGRGGWETGPHSEECHQCRGSGIYLQEK